LNLDNLAVSGDHLFMSTAIKQAYQDDLTYIIDYPVSKEDYQTWKKRITNQLLKSVEVPGFRKGKAPEHLALKQINEGALQQTLLQETISKYYPEAFKLATEILQKDERVILSTSIVAEDPYTQEQEDGSFLMRVKIDLVPNVDLSLFDTMTIVAPTEADISGRSTEAEVLERERKRFIAIYNEYEIIQDKAKPHDRIACHITENGEEKLNQQLTLGTGDYPEDFEKHILGLKAGDAKEFSIAFQGTTINFKIEVNEVLRPKFTTVSEVVEANAEAKQQFANSEDFDEKIKGFYKEETDKILQDKAQSIMIKDIVDTIPEFELPQDRLDSEVDRIVGVIQDDGVSKGISLKEAFELSGIPSPKPITNDVDLREAVVMYVSKEFKWTGIIDAVYQNKVERKFTSEEVKQASQEIEANRQKYGIPPQATADYIENVAIDRLKRYAATQWMFTKINKNMSDLETKSELKKAAKKAA
jgi:trigger factor